MSLTFSRRRGGPGLTMRSVPSPPVVSPPSFVGEVHGGIALNALSLDLSSGGFAATDTLLGLAVCSAAGSGGTVDLVAAAGWTPLTGTIHTALDDLAARLFWATGDETSFVVDDITEEGGRVTGLVVAYRIVDQVAPIGDSDGQATASGTSHASPSITPAADNSMLVYLAAIDADGAATWTPPAGMDERADVPAVLSLTLTAADVVQASTDPVSATGTSSVSKPGVAFLVALTPAG